MEYFCYNLNTEHIANKALMSALIEKKENKREEKEVSRKWITTSPSRGVYLYKLIWRIKESLRLAQ